MPRFLLFGCIALAWVAGNTHAISDDLPTSNAAEQEAATEGAPDKIPAIANASSDLTKPTAPNVTVVALKSLDPADTAAILTEVYKETLDVIVEPLPKMKCIAIRADENTTKRIREFVGRLEESHPNSGKRPIRIMPINPNRPDLAIPDAGNCPAPAKSRIG
jgi:hypothetical protein